jgi:hypothetical protein
VDRLAAALRGDTRMRITANGRCSVATVAKTEPLAPVPARPYPAMVAEQRIASRQALVAYLGNRYSVPPELGASSVAVSHPVGGEHLDIATAAGIAVARHLRAADGLGVTVRESGHGIALETVAIAAPSARPHRRKERIPRTRGPCRRRRIPPPIRWRRHPSAVESSTTTTDSTVINLSAYERAAQQRTAN